MCNENRKLSKELAPEDVRRGQFVSVLYIIDETVPFSIDADSPWRRKEPLRYKLLPWQGVRPPCGTSSGCSRNRPHADA